MKATERNKICEDCKNIFYCPPNIGIGMWRRRRFCSRKCGAKLIHIGQIPWCAGLHLTKEHKENIGKGRKGLHYSSKTEIKKGQRLSPSTEFKKGNIPWNWKGDAVGYYALHSWVKRGRGKAKECSINKNHRGLFQWANKSHEYKRDLSDWISLCRKCHYEYDRNTPKLAREIFKLVDNHLTTRI